MNEGNLNVEELKKYWIAEAEEALQIAQHLIEKNDY